MWTYNEIEESVSQLTVIFHKYGLSKGDSIAILLDNSAEMLFIIFAALHLGVICVTLNPSATSGYSFIFYR